MATVRQQLADARYAHIARKYGMQNSLRTLWEARKLGIGPSVAIAVLEQESGGKNIFGHDPTIFVGAGKVTKSKYLAYRRLRGHSLMQGVGPMQLTWWEYQDEADRLGGCWKTKYNIRVGLMLLARLIDVYGERKGLAVYNGGATNPNYQYADQVLARKRKWHQRFT